MRDPGGRRILVAIESGERLPRQYQDGWLVAQLHDVAIGLDDLVGIGRTQSDKTGYRAQGGKLLYRLMGGAVLAVAHSVMREDEERR